MMRYSCVVCFVAIVAMSLAPNRASPQAPGPSLMQLESKIPLGDVSGRIEETSVTLSAGAQLGPVPVLVANTFHPNWRRRDGNPIYAVTPFLMLTFVEKPTAIDFGRGTLEKLGVLISLLSLVGLCGFLVLGGLRNRRLNRL